MRRRRQRNNYIAISSADLEVNQSDPSSSFHLTILAKVAAAAAGAAAAAAAAAAATAAAETSGSSPAMKLYSSIRYIICNFIWRIHLSIWLIADVVTAAAAATEDSSESSKWKINPPFAMNLLNFKSIKTNIFQFHAKSQPRKIWLPSIRWRKPRYCESWCCCCYCCCCCCCCCCACHATTRLSKSFYINITSNVARRAIIHFIWLQRHY